jgi:alpha-glucoside transport system substrate-binding protein
MQAYETYGKWATDARYTVGGADGTLSTNFMDAIYKPFSDSPEAMMVKQLPFAGNEIQNKFTASQYGTNYDFFVVPGIQGLQGSSDCMMAFSDKPEVRALVAYLSSTEGGVNWAKADFGLSPNMSAAGNYTDPALAKKAVAFYATPRFIRHIVDSMPGNFYSVEWKAIRDYLSGGDLSTVLADAAAAQAAALKQ